MNGLRAYTAILRGSVVTGLVYRFGFLFTILGNVIYLCVAYFLWKSIYRFSPTLHGLTFNQAFIYVALGSTVFILLKNYAEWSISREINDGKIAVYLTKPLDYQFYWLFNSLGFSLTNLLAITIPTVLLLTLVFKVTIPFGLGIILFPISLVLAFLISFNIDFMIGLAAFYTESTWGLSMTKEIIVTVLSGALLPLQFFPAAIQRILLWLPFQAIYYSPLSMISQPVQGWEVFLPMLAIQFLWMAASFAVTRLFYGQAIKVLRISGG